MKPILFNTEMVRAILDGRKTVTRRVVKFRDGKNPNWTGYVKDGLTLYNGNNEPCNMPVPFKVNDILYVRETWALEGESENYITGEKRTYYAYKADPFKRNGNWRPSIHMPKEAARIFLKVTGVRVERLQDIMRDPSGSNNQVVREGCSYGCDFIALWNNTIKKDQLQYYGWNANPYVWVIEFEVIDKAAAMANDTER